VSLDSRLNAWVAAGLIDLGTADSIRAFEGRRERPVARWAIAGLGLLAVLLGIVLVISANWDLIPHAAKLGGHMALLVGAGAAHWWARGKGNMRVAEGALLCLLMPVADAALQPPAPAASAGVSPSADNRADLQKLQARLAFTQDAARPEPALGREARL
jgi:hypothetical protein